MRPALPTVAALGTVAALLGACGLDTSGIGPNSGSLGSATSGASTGSDGDDATSTVAATTEQGGSADSETSAVATAMDPDTTGDDGSGDASDTTSTTSAATTEPVDPCADNPPFTLVIEANAAAVTAPVALGQLFDNTQYVYGEVANDGSATFQVDVPCGDEYMVWADVYDAEPGPVDLPVPGDPADELRIEFGGVTTNWTYGCQTAGFDLWTRQAVTEHELECLTDDKIVYTLAAGTHALSIVPLESGDHTGNLLPGDVAAVERIIITNQLDVQP